MKIDLTHCQSFLNGDIVRSLEQKVSSIYDTIYHKTGAGNDFLGWVDLPSEIDESMLADIEKTAADLRKKSDIFVVIGIGGSYLGARAVIEALQNHFAPLTGEKPLIVYAGHRTVAADSRRAYLACLEIDAGTESVVVYHAAVQSELLRSEDDMGNSLLIDYRNEPQAVHRVWIDLLVVRMLLQDFLKKPGILLQKLPVKRVEIFVVIDVFLHAAVTAGAVHRLAEDDLMLLNKLPDLSL